MRLHLAAIAALALLSACAPYTYNQGPVMQAGLDRFIGQDVAVALGTLGLPDEQMEVAGKTVYIWRNAGRQSHQVAGDTFADVTLEDMEAPGGLTHKRYTRNYQSPGTHTEYREYACAIKLMLNNKNIVEYSQYEGDGRGCAKYAEKLSVQ